MHFTEIDLAARPVRTPDQCARFSNGDISPRRSPVCAVSPDVGGRECVRHRSESWRCPQTSRAWMNPPAVYASRSPSMSSTVDVPAPGVSIFAAGPETNVGDVIHSPDTSGGDVFRPSVTSSAWPPISPVSISPAPVCTATEKIRGHINSELHPELGVSFQQWCGAGEGYRST